MAVVLLSLAGLREEEGSHEDEPVKSVICLARISAQVSLGQELTHVRTNIMCSAVHFALAIFPGRHSSRENDV